MIKLFYDETYTFITWTSKFYPRILAFIGIRPYYRDTFFEEENPYEALSVIKFTYLKPFSYFLDHNIYTFEFYDQYIYICYKDSPILDIFMISEIDLKTRINLDDIMIYKKIKNIENICIPRLYCPAS